MPVRWSQALNFQTFLILIKQRRNSDPTKRTFRIEKAAAHVAVRHRARFEHAVLAEEQSVPAELKTARRTLA
jgi:hypothetical protein